MAQKNSGHQARVILWGVPRCLSTSFLKCMTNVEDSICWHEPYLYANTDFTGIMIPEIRGTMTSGADDVPCGDNIYEAVKHDYDWVKGQLEKGQPGKSLIFNKEMVQGIAGHYDALPKGYRHTFLIRHPLKVFASFKKMVSKFPGKMYNMHPGKIPPGYFFKEMYDLFEYLIKEEIEPEPMIIDADDLLADPPRMIKAYCDELGIAYSDSLLTWPAGDEVMYSKWMCQKELIMVGKVAHQSTFKFTGFEQSSPMPNRAGLPDDVLKLADASMQYYDKLYEQRFKCS